MKNRSILVAITVSLSMALPVLAADNSQPARMGCGTMTFDTVPGWGLRPDGTSALGPTHGAVVIDAQAAFLARAPDGVTPSGLFWDDLHPSAAGHEVLAELLAPVVTELLDARAAP